jgi:hypothetical protein
VLHIVGFFFDDPFLRLLVFRCVRQLGLLHLTVRSVLAGLNLRAFHLALQAEGPGRASKSTESVKNLKFNDTLGGSKKKVALEIMAGSGSVSQQGEL